MTIRKLCLHVFAGSYLLVAFYNAWTPLTYQKTGSVAEVVHSLLEYTGANNDFGYFAPSVSSELRVQLQLEGQNIYRETYDLLTDNQEVNLRILSMVTTATSQQSLRDVFARSWAATVFGTRPDIDRVTVSTRAYQLPTMAQFRSGQRPHWQVIYQGTFDPKPN